ncbi:hypothetical protein L596_028466 [Steinernema carpocapsae]|uniref:Uncharacterized protein n=1 Tax=Steinernema carpocapsae TaxID=34508 RepID=A0A4U5LYI5_STECR|nr:hypothetical protein L596_028466 [Steinernema carpocapsae]
MEIFVKQFSNFAPSYVAMRLTISHSRFYEVYVAAQSLLGASSSLWMTFGATSLYPEDDRPQTSEKNRFNDGFSEMTTVLKVYHKFITSQNPRQFCNQNGILIDAIYEAEKQYQSIVGKPMRHCSALEMVVQQNKLLQHEVMSHMYVATLNENTLKYVIVGMDYPADIRQSDAIYVDPSNISLRHKHVLCDGYFSPVDGKYFLVNTMRHPDA